MVGVRERIEALLRERNRDIFTIKQVADILSISPGHARKELCLLTKANLLHRVDRGLYRHPSGLIAPGFPDPRLRIHGIKVELRSNKDKGRPSRDYLQLATVLYPSPTAHRHRTNGSYVTYGEWSARPMTITVFPKQGYVEVFLQASTFPLHLLEVHSYLSTLCHVWGVPEELAEVSQADWNIDFPAELKNKLGISALSVAAFKKWIVQIYQKAETMARLEVRDFEKHPVKALNGWIESIFSSIEEVTA